jgi:hypothetical protein
MISITLGTIVYGYAGNAIHIGGITTGNTPIAEIRFMPENEIGYAIFTGEIFPTFTEAFAAHVKHASSIHPLDFEITQDEEFERAVQILGPVPTRR